MTPTFWEAVLDAMAAADDEAQRQWFRWIYVDRPERGSLLPSVKEEDDGAFPDDAA